VLNRFQLDILRVVYQTSHCTQNEILNVASRCHLTTLAQECRSLTTTARLERGAFAGQQRDFPVFCWLFRGAVDVVCGNRRSPDYANKTCVVSMPIVEAPSRSLVD
jgi:hypothetical protein